MVNPKYETLGGRKCYPSIAALPEAPDATFIAVPREGTIEILKELSARGAGGAICYAAGFAEVGGEGVELQKQFIAASGDLAVVGPNCYGILNYLSGIILWPAGHNGHKVETGCALVTLRGAKPVYNAADPVHPPLLAADAKTADRLIARLGGAEV